MTELLDLVDDLTKPVTIHVTQEIWETRMRDGRPVTDDNGNPIRVHTGNTRKTKATQPALLHQLDAAIRSTMARAGGGGNAKHERNILDAEALYEAIRIVTTITDWCRSVGIRATRNPTRDLRAWYAARIATNPTTDEFHVRELTKWRGVIRAKLNRPEQLEVTAPCPQCHYSTWEDEYEREDGTTGSVERNRPVLVEYWPNARDFLSTAVGTCRRCGREWRGETALRELRWEVDAAEKRAQNTA